MFIGKNPRACITQSLSGRTYGPKKAGEILTLFNRFTQEFIDQGYTIPIAEARAMVRTQEELNFLLREKAKGAMKELQVQAYGKDRINQGYNVRTSALALDGKTGNGVGTGIARAAVSMIEPDKRFKGENYYTTRESYRKRYWELMSGVIDSFKKGSFGRQVGKVHLTNIVRELTNVNSGDSVAKDIANAIRKTTDVMADDFNLAGGSLKKLVDYVLPQRHNAAKIIKVGEDAWVKAQKDWVDVGEMRFPDGSPIKDLDATLRHVYKTLSTEGAIRIPDGGFPGRSKAMGDMLDMHRFLVYKDADSWLANHNAFGDGNIFDVFSGHIDAMAHKTALVQTFGRNPEIFGAKIRGMVLKEAAKAQATLGKKRDRQAVSDATAVMKNKFDPMFETIMRHNPMDANSGLATFVTTTSHSINAAVMGSLITLAIPGDFAATVAHRVANKQPIWRGIGHYLSAFLLPGGYTKAERAAARAGFAFDEMTNALYATERFQGFNTYGAPIARRLSDSVMRLGLVTRHTNIARWTAQRDIMGLLDEYRQRPFKDLPMREVLARYSIGEREWNAVMGATAAYSPNGGKITFFRPLDILNSKLINRDELYRKFFSFVHAEAGSMVPSSSIESQVVLRGTSRPDTLLGAITYSASMYKNFTATYTMMVMRTLLSKDISLGRKVGYMAAVIVGAMMAGAISKQLRSVRDGKTPQPMDSASFWASALMTGGGLGMMGDYLFQGINDKGRGFETLGGPLANVTFDTANLFLGDGYAWVNAFERNKEWELKAGARGVEFLRRNVPGSNIWWAKLVLEREIWDKLQMMADPRALQKYKTRERAMKRDYGNEYFAPPGKSLFEGM